MATSEPRHAIAPPTLRTLGALHLAGSALTRPKPLLLLAYLAHEGPTDRKRLARLFFASSRDPRDALATTLRRLGGLVEGVAERGARVRARVTTDAIEFQRHAIASEPHVALGRYGGSFIEGAQVACGVEVDEWIASTREQLGSIARDLHLRMARAELGLDRAEAAWQHAQTALGLTETFALETEPTAAVLQTFDEAGLPVPDGWWRAVAPLGCDRPWPHVHVSAAVATHRAPETSGVRRRSMQRDPRWTRSVGLRRPRRLTERP